METRQRGNEKLARERKLKRTEDTEELAKNYLVMSLLNRIRRTRRIDWKHYGMHCWYSKKDTMNETYFRTA